MPPRKIIPRPKYDRDIKDLTRRYRKALEDLRRELMALPIEDTFHRAQYEAALKDLAAITKRLNLETTEWVKEYIPKAARDGVATTLVSLGVASSFASTVATASFSGLNKRMVEAVMSDLQTDLLAVTQNVERRVRNAVRSTTAEVMRANMTQGINGLRTNRREILADLRKKLGASLDTGIVDAAGRKWKPDTYVDMVVRTKMMEANTAAATNEALERGVLYARISSHGAPDPCSAWEGKILKLVDDAPGDFPTVDEARASREVFHPRCAHILLPERNPPELVEQMGTGVVQPPTVEYIPAENIKDATEQAKRLGIAEPNYSNFSLETANGINRTVHMIRERLGDEAAQFPFVGTFHQLAQQIGKNPPRGALGVCATRTNKIGFATGYFGKRPSAGETVAQFMARCKASGWCSTDNPRHVFAHEFGHALYNTARGKLGYYDANPVRDGFKALSNEYRRSGKGVLLQKLSAYGISDEGEYAAEAFAEYLLSDTPRDDAKLVGEWLKKMFERT